MLACPPCTERYSSNVVPGSSGLVGRQSDARGAKHGSACGCCPRPRAGPSSWRDAALAFVDSLRVAAFETRLMDIVLASAVRDPELRAALTEAERAVAEDTRRSFSASVGAFNVARERWRRQRVPALTAPTPGGYEPGLASEEALLSELAGAVRGLEDVLEVQPFAGDLSEYVWFRRALGERASAGLGRQPQKTRAGRLSSWRSGLCAGRFSPSAIPTTGGKRIVKALSRLDVGDGTTTTITGAQADLIPEAPSQPAQTVLFLQLANVPGRGRPLGIRPLVRAITDRVEGMKTAG